MNSGSDAWQPRPQVAPEETHCLSSENYFKSVRYLLIILDADVEVGLEIGFSRLFLIQGMSHRLFERPKQRPGAEGRRGENFFMSRIGNVTILQTQVPYLLTFLF